MTGKREFAAAPPPAAVPRAFRNGVPVFATPRPTIRRRHPWWFGFGAFDFGVNCGGARHRLRYTDGSVTPVPTLDGRGPEHVGPSRCADVIDAARQLLGEPRRLDASVWRTLPERYFWQLSLRHAAAYCAVRQDPPSDSYVWAAATQPAREALAEVVGPAAMSISAGGPGIEVGFAGGRNEATGWGPPTPGVTSDASRNRTTVWLPPAWLDTVWRSGLAVVAGRFVLDCVEAGAKSGEAIALDGHLDTTTINVDTECAAEPHAPTTEARLVAMLSEPGIGTITVHTSVAVALWATITVVVGADRVTLEGVAKRDALMSYRRLGWTTTNGRIAATWPRESARDAARQIIATLRGVADASLESLVITVTGASPS